MATVLDLERKYRGVWVAMAVAIVFLAVEVALRVRLLGFALRDTLLSFEDNCLRWFVLTLVVVLGIVINRRNREAALTRQILETLNDEIANPLAVIYTQLEMISIRAPGLRQEDLQRLAGVQQAVMRIASLVREISEGKQVPAPESLEAAPPAGAV